MLENLSFILSRLDEALLGSTKSLFAQMVVSSLNLQIYPVIAQKLVQGFWDSN
jgi:hypothetical protein